MRKNNEQLSPTNTPEDSNERKESARMARFQKIGRGIILAATLCAAINLGAAHVEAMASVTTEPAPRPVAEQTYNSPTNAFDNLKELIGDMDDLGSEEFNRAARLLAKKGDKDTRTDFSDPLDNLTPDQAIIEQAPPGYNDTSLKDGTTFSIDQTPLDKQ